MTKRHVYDSLLVQIYNDAHFEKFAEGTFKSLQSVS